MECRLVLWMKYQSDSKFLLCSLVLGLGALRRGGQKVFNLFLFALLSLCWIVGGNVILIQKDLLGWRNYNFLHLPDALTGKKKKEQWKSQANLNAEIFSFAQKRNTYRNILISQTLF